MKYYLIFEGNIMGAKEILSVIKIQLYKYVMA